MKAKTRRLFAVFSIGLFPFTLAACPGEGEGEVEEFVPGGEGGEGSD